MVVVAGKGEFEAKNLKAFVAGPTRKASIIMPGSGNHYSLSLDEVSDFMVIDRGGPEKNCDEVFLEEAIEIDY